MSEENIQTSTADTGSNDTAPETNQPVEGEVAQDNMPWLLRDKFQGATEEEVIRNQAMAYPELQNKMGKWWGAPKEGNYDVAGLSEYGISAEDPILNGMTKTFKEMGLSNEAIKKLASSYDDSLKGMAQKMEADLAKSMTPEFAQAAKRVEGYLSKFSKEEQETYKSWLQTPEDFARFNTLIALNPNGNQGNNIPSQTSNYGFKYETAAQVEREKIDNHAKYKKDAGYREEVARRYRDAKTRELKG